MSTNGKPAPAGDDGFGGTGLSLAPSDGEILDDPEVSGGPEFEVGPQSVGAPAAAPDQRETDPWAGFSDDTRSLAEQKGWKTLEDAVKSYQEAQSLIGSRDTEAERRAAAAEAQARQAMELLQQFQAGGAPQGAQGGQGGGDPLAEVFWSPNFEELERVGGGDPRLMLQIYHEQVALPQIKAGLAAAAAELLGHTDKVVGDRTAPLEQFAGRATVRDTARELATEFPTAFVKHKDELTQMLMRDPARRTSPEAIRGAFNELLARDAREAEAQRRAQEGETAIGGRRAPAAAGRSTADEDEMLRQEIEGAGRFVRDGL